MNCHAVAIKIKIRKSRNNLRISVKGRNVPLKNAKSANAKYKKLLWLNLIKERNAKNV